MELTNTDEGYQLQSQSQLTKNFMNGLSGYVRIYHNCQDITANQIGILLLVKLGNRSLNDPGLSWSNFAVPHKLVGNISCRIEYGNYLPPQFHWFTRVTRQAAGRTHIQTTLTVTEFSDLMFILNRLMISSLRTIMA
jgi:hypothetical protein